MSQATSPKVEIRRATVDDAPGLARVHVESWRAAYRGLLPENVLAGLSLETFENNWRRRFEEGTRITLLANVDREPAGFIAYGHSRDPDAAGDTGEIYAVYLTEPYWGKGIGKAMWQAAAPELAAQYQRVSVWVLRDNPRARAFYERMGMTADGAEQPLALYGLTLPEVRYACDAQTMVRTR